MGETSMKRTKFAALAFFALAFAITGNGMASPIQNVAGDGFEDLANDSIFSYWANSGTLLFTSSENNDGSFYNKGDLELLVESFLNVDSSTFQLVKTEGASITVTNYEDDQSGTWEVNPTGNTINFYAVKADKAFAMYILDPAAGTGSWSTYDLFVGGYHPEKATSLEISHFTGYNMSTAPVPEPASLLLFGAGLAGLAGISKRRKK